MAGDRSLLRGRTGSRTVLIALGASPPRRRLTSQSEATLFMASCDGSHGSLRSAAPIGSGFLVLFIPVRRTRFASASSLNTSLERRDSRSDAAATNTAGDPAPFGIGFHPYLLAGAGGLDRAGVTLVARRRLVLDGRGLPVGDEAVSGTSYDLDGSALNGRTLDDCYTDLFLGSDNRWHALFEEPGRHVELWADAEFGYAMCYTGDSLSEAADRRKAIAIEPMTCPPNAFRTGTDLIELRAGERWQASWGITTAIG